MGRQRGPGGVGGAEHDLVHPKWTRPPEVYDNSRVDPVMRMRLNGHPESVSERGDGGGSGSNDLRVVFKARGMLALAKDGSQIRRY